MTEIQYLQVSALHFCAQVTYHILKGLDLFYSIIFQCILLALQTDTLLLVPAEAPLVVAQCLSCL